ncbi:MAG: GGDEF domain-containing protein [Pseudomonadota bacterium]|nr:GGDEF domain-containing protein [Pseudomonadota bacterium]
MNVRVKTSKWSFALDALCPMHVQVDQTGRIHHVGPTIQKLRPDLEWVGQSFLEVFRVLRPHRLGIKSNLLEARNIKLHLQLGDPPNTTLQGIVVSDPFREGVLINLSFGISVLDAVQTYGLTNADFAATDMAIEMLFLVEAKSAAMNASLSLNRRLEKAKNAAELQAFTDSLTGLKNRRAVEQSVERLLEDGAAFTFMQLDLDFFKAVNDTMGHAAGDHVLQVVSSRLLTATRAGDDVARIGGDEFVIVLRGPIDDIRLAELAQGIIDHLSEPIMFEGEMCRISTSIGISKVQSGRVLTSDQLMQQADKALYSSKARGRSQYAFSKPCDFGKSGSP